MTTISVKDLFLNGGTVISIPTFQILYDSGRIICGFTPYGFQTYFQLQLVVYYYADIFMVLAAFHKKFSPDRSD